MGEIKMNSNRIGNISFTVNYGTVRGCSMFYGYDLMLDMELKLKAMAASDNSWAKRFYIYNTASGRLNFHTSHTDLSVFHELLSCDEKKYVDTINDIILFFINFMKTIKNKWHIDVNIPVEISAVYYTDDRKAHLLTVDRDTYV